MHQRTQADDCYKYPAAMVSSNSCTVIFVNKGVDNIHAAASRFESQIEKLDDVAETLEELWISYNQVTTLDGLSNLSNLTRLYMSNNSVKNWAELDKLVSEGGCAVLKVPKHE